MNTFVLEPDVSTEKRKWRIWLMHCLVKTARHYTASRNLVLAQLGESTRSAVELAQGRQLPLLDFGFEMEDCITSLEKAVVCIKALSRGSEISATRTLKLNDEMQALNALRRQQEHMHTQIAAGQTGNGPIIVTVTNDNDGIQLRNLTMSFSAIYRLVDALYRDIATLFPAHDPDSPAQSGGIPKMSMAVTMEVRHQSADASGAAPKSVD
ncbi:hypothetical protein [Duganella sp. HH105]|uniref:hypothetical protein n=1 Tax=Duganella sp. HH105 TaxID=1781067 RepID=UPI00114D2F7F|nr:hypothetical protein [Duganella sp. HH105]